MFKHTQGPWRLKRSTTFSEQRELVEYFWVGHGPFGDEEPILSKFCHANEANCRLIACAPELLEALMDACAVIEAMAGEGPRVTTQYYRDLINKAMGEI